MSRVKKFRSTSKFSEVIWTASFIIIIIISAVIFKLESFSLVFLIVLMAPLIPFLFMIKSCYTIENGKILKFELGGKTQEPILSIPISTINGVQILYKNRKKSGLILQTSPYKTDDIKIRIRYVDGFIKILQETNAAIQIAP